MWSICSHAVSAQEVGSGGDTGSDALDAGGIVGIVIAALSFVGVVSLVVFSVVCPMAPREAAAVPLTSQPVTA